MEVTEESLKSVYSQKGPEELIALHQSGNLSELAYTAIEHVMGQHAIEIPARPKELQENQTDDSLKKYWSGSKPLSSAFWVISIVGSLCAIFFGYAVANLLKMPYERVGIYTAITAPYFLFLTVVLWRTSKGKSARLVKFLGLMALSVIITLPFYLYAFMAVNR